MCVFFIQEIVDSRLVESLEIDIQWGPYIVTDNSHVRIFPNAIGFSDHVGLGYGWMLFNSDEPEQTNEAEYSFEALASSSIVDAHHVRDHTRQIED